MTDSTTSHALAVTIEERIKMLRRQRALYRKSPHRAEWSLPRIEAETELRALVRLVRQSRRIAKAASSDRIYHELGYHQAQSLGPVA